MKTRISLILAMLGLTILFAAPVFSQGQVVQQSSPASNPQLMLVTPNGGEQLKQGETYKIAWMAQNAGNIQSYDLFLSTDNGRSWQNIAKDIPGKMLSYDWKVSGVPSPQCLIKVSAKSAVLVQMMDQSDKNFTILK